MAYERRRFEELRAEASLMTLMGLEGEDIRDPAIKLLVETGEKATTSFDELVAWLSVRAPRRK